MYNCCSQLNLGQTKISNLVISRIIAWKKSIFLFVVKDHLHCSKNLSTARAVFLTFISRLPRHAGNIKIKETEIVLASLSIASL